MIIESQSLDATSSYKLLIGSIVPRAIAWVSTMNTAGICNLAPISFFTAAGRLPPTISISLQPKSDGLTLKDTFLNIRDTGEFVVNMISLPHIERAHKTAFEFPSDVDEFDAVGLGKEASTHIKPPRVAGVPIAMECKLDRIIPMRPAGDHLVFGEVLAFHVRDDLYLDRGRIDTGALNAVGRLAAEYTLVENAFITPLEGPMLTDFLGRRSVRLDGRPDDYSPINQATWSASGSVKQI